MSNWTVSQADALSIPLPDDSVDLVFCSPPYEAKRRYAELDFRLKGDEWVDWAVPRFMESLRVSRGLVAWVVDGCTEKYRYSAVPEKLIVRLHEMGANVRRPCYYKRHGIPGSGGPDWLKSMLETVVCATAGHGRLPWSDNVACGEAPKWNPGGEPSHRMPSGRRVAKIHTKAGPNGMVRQGYNPPDKANPGNIIDCGAVGGGNIGHHLAHENEAPFPLKLAEFFVKSFCPPGGTVCDPFSGSGTTGHAAVANGRNYIGFDMRASQIDLASRRLCEVSE